MPTNPFGGLLGIDIGFTDESLKNSEYALCRRYRSKIVALYSEVREQGEDELAPFRERNRILNLSLLQKEEPRLYQQLTKDELPMFRRDTLYWHKDLLGRYGIKGRNVRKLKRYMESKPSAKVYLRKMPPDLAKELLAKTDEENLQSAWYELPYEKHKQFCKPCPIRPLKEDNCYLRFSNYPGMTGFRQGFMLTILYAEGIDQERLKQALFSFLNVDRQKGELPRDKLAELYEMCSDTPVTKGPEDFFNKVVDVLEELKPEGLESNWSEPLKLDTLG